jgi:hypothetical protein
MKAIATTDSASIGSNQTTERNRNFDDSTDDGAWGGIFPGAAVLGLLFRGFFFLLNLQLF